MTQARIQQLQRHRLQRPGGCRDQGTERPTSLSDELITAVTAAAVGSDAICRDLARRLTQSYGVSVARSTTDRSPPGTNWCCHHYPSARHQSWMRTGRRTSTCTTRSISWHRSMCRRSTLPSCLIETSRQSYTARGAEPSGSCSPSTCVGSDLTRHCARWSRNAPGSRDGWRRSRRTPGCKFDSWTRWVVTYRRTCDTSRSSAGPVRRMPPDPVVHRTAAPARRVVAQTVLGPRHSPRPALPPSGGSAGCRQD